MRRFLEHSFKGLAYFFINKNYRAFIRLMILLGDKKRYKPSKLKVLNYSLNIPDGPSFLWQFYEIFFKDIYKFESKRSKPVIFDCGANIGTACLYFKKQHPQALVHAFEPDPKIYQILKTNLAQNDLEDIQLYEAAVWKEDGTLSFGSEGSDSGSIFQEDNQVKVKALDLKKLIEKEAYIDLLKIDIEGAEVEVIKHCAGSLDKVENLFIEYHSFNGRRQDFEELLSVVTNAGYRYYIENVMFRKLPFLNKTGKYSMDNQINVFAYRMEDFPKEKI